MKRLIKADLAAILRLAGEYRFLAADRLELSIGRLCRQEYTDFLFLARTPWCWLFDLSAVYDSGTYANLCALAYQGVPGGPVIALFLHIDKTVEGLPWGSVTLLDYREAAHDAETFSALAGPQRERHLKLLRKRYLQKVQYCSILEVIQYLKTGR